MDQNTNSMTELDELLSIDMIELGVRPLNWLELSKDIDESTNDSCLNEKATNFTVYSAELQFTNNGNKITTNDDNLSATDNDDNMDYDIDPETGMLINFIFVVIFF